MNNEDLMLWVKHSIGIVVFAILSLEFVVKGGGDQYLFEIERKTPINFECDHEQCMRTSYATFTEKQEDLATERCVRRIAPDGNCLFRSISYFLHGNEDNYDKVRQDIVNYVVLNWRDYESFAVGLETTYPEYVRSADQYQIFMSRNRRWGDQIELVAATHTYKIRLLVFYDAVNFHEMREEYDDRTFALLYRGSKDHGHYSVVEDIRVLYSEVSRCQKRKILEGYTLSASVPYEKRRERYPPSGIIPYKRKKEKSPLSRMLTYTRKLRKHPVQPSNLSQKRNRVPV